MWRNTNGDDFPDEGAPALLAIEDGETSWIQAGEWKYDTSGWRRFDALLLADDSSIYTLTNGYPSSYSDTQYIEAFSPAGEPSFIAETEASKWHAMAWQQGELLLHGRHVPDLGEDENEWYEPLSFIRFDAQLDQLSLEQASYDHGVWVLLGTTMYVEDERVWIAGRNYGDSHGVTGSYACRGLVGAVYFARRLTYNRTPWPVIPMPSTETS